MDYDFNTAKAMGFFFSMMNFFQRKIINAGKVLSASVQEDLIRFLNDIDQVFQFIVVEDQYGPESSEWKDKMDELVESILQLRKTMKKEKKYDIADKLRDLLVKME